MNAVFCLQVQYTVGDTIIIGVAVSGRGSGRGRIRGVNAVFQGLDKLVIFAESAIIICIDFEWDF
jgi:hypothetical protein